MKKNTKNITYDQVKSLFKRNGSDWISKTNEEFVEAIRAIINGTNTNDIPWTTNDIKLQAKKLKDFSFSGIRKFNYVCDLVASPIELLEESNDWKNEKIEMVNFQSNELKEKANSELGVVYILTTVIDEEEYIIKIGCSRTSFKGRLGSYNCGVINNIRTASTTNIKILQSMICTGATYKLYLNFEGAAQPYVWEDVTSVNFSSSIIYAIEDIMVKKYIENFGTKPIGNTQTNATE